MKKIILTILLCFSASFVSANELVIIIGNQGQYEDGDVLHAMTERRILTVHAQHETHVKKFGKKSNGLRASGTLLEDYLENMSEWKVERTGNSTVRKINLISGEVTNHGDPEIYVQEYIDLRKRHPRHKIFGEEGLEYWYGGDNVSLTQINKVWDKIESKTSKLRVNHKQFPWNASEKKRFLIVDIDESMTDDEASEYESPKLGPAIMKNGAMSENVLKRRSYKVDYANDLGFTAKEVADIRKKDKSNDHRKNDKVKKIKIKKKDINGGFI